MPADDLKKTASDAADSVKQAGTVPPTRLTLRKNRLAIMLNAAWSTPATILGGSPSSFSASHGWRWPGRLSLAMRQPSCCGAYRGTDSAFGRFTRRRAWLRKIGQHRPRNDQQKPSGFRSSSRYDGAVIAAIVKRPHKRGTKRGIPRS